MEGRKEEGKRDIKEEGRKEREREMKERWI
jgi:hypothetical protein